MRLIVLTAPREPSYLLGTLGSAFLADKQAHDLTSVDLMLDSRDVRCVTPVRHHRLVNVHRLSIAEVANLEGKASIYRITCNFHRALALAPDEEDVLIIEDDLRFRDGWVAMMQAAMVAARAHTERFVLVGYAAYAAADFTAVPSRDGTKPMIAEFPHGMFYGNQMLYVPRSVRSDLAKYVQAYGVMADAEPADLLVRDFCHKAGVPILATLPSLVQHVGWVSASKSPTHQTCMWEWPA